MKVFAKISLSLAVAVALTIPVFSVSHASAATITTTATGYTKASDVEYKTSGKYIANWGARGEACTFLSKYATAFYTGSYTYEVLSQNDGGSSQSNAPSSALYSALQSMMRAKHTHQTSYDETRYQYRYTDCVGSDYENFSSFYSGTIYCGDWIGGDDTPWNREHTWPNSKGLGGNDENDIMMLRPTVTSENSSRGNTAYGESRGYFDPGESVRGDCARIVLYVYVRWGNTSYMWGTNGVMESLNVLLEWMEEDPVDTWEMGRNDAVQAITGTRNVFVDYPEYAWLLFGQSVPADITTPSGTASQGTAGGTNGDTADGECAHEYDEWFVTVDPTETADGAQVRTCLKCGKSETETIPKLGENEQSAEGCFGTVSGSVAGVALLLGGAFVLGKRKK